MPDTFGVSHRYWANQWNKNELKSINHEDTPSVPGCSWTADCCKLEQVLSLYTCPVCAAADAGLNRSAVTQIGSFEGETGIHQEIETVKKTLEIFALKLSPYVKPNSNEESLAVTRIVSNIRLFQLCPGRINRVFFFASRKRKDTLEVWEKGWKNSTWKLV